MELRLTLSEKEKAEIVAALRRGVEPKILPVTLSPAQMDELVRRVVDLLKLEPIKVALTGEEKSEIINETCQDVLDTLSLKEKVDEAHIVSAVCERFKNHPINLTDKQMDELGKFVWQKFLARLSE